MSATNNIKDFFNTISEMKALSHSDFDIALLASRIAENSDICSSIVFAPENQWVFQLARRCEEFFYIADEPRFTHEDLVDALCYQDITCPYLAKLSDEEAVSDEDFERIVTMAAEDYRSKMSDEPPVHQIQIADALATL